MSMMILIEAQGPGGFHIQGALMMALLLFVTGLIYTRIHLVKRPRPGVRQPSREPRERTSPGDGRQNRLLDQLLHSERRIKSQSRAPGGFGGGLGLGGTFGGGHFPGKEKGIQQGGTGERP